MTALGRRVASGLGEVARQEARQRAADAAKAKQAKPTPEQVEKIACDFFRKAMQQ